MRNKTSTTTITQLGGVHRLPDKPSRLSSSLRFGLQKIIAASTICLLTLTTIPSPAMAQELLNPIVGIQGVSAGNQIFTVASSSKPLVLKSQADAAKHFKGKDLEKLLAKVDLKKQFILVFAWRGSGQDQLRFDVLESFPEQIQFKLIRGRTKDLRPHVYIFALRQGVIWRTDDPKAGSGRRNPGKKTERRTIEKLDESVQVMARGKLTAGIFAIGGETTGVTITAKNMTLELELGRNPRLLRKAGELDGKPVVVTGELTMKKGVEIPRRWIIQVSQLLSADEDPSQGVSTDSDGSVPSESSEEDPEEDDPEGSTSANATQLPQSITLRDAQSGFAGESGHIWRIERNGKWTRRPFLNAKERETDASGSLNAAAILAIVEGLEHFEFEKLPKKSGSYSGVNPHVLTVEVGKESRSLVLRGGEQPRPVRSNATPVNRLASIVYMLRKSMSQLPQ